MRRSFCWSNFVTRLLAVNPMWWAQAPPGGRLPGGRHRTRGTRTALHLEWPAINVRAALAYAVRYAGGVADALADMNQSASDLARQPPGRYVFTVDVRDEAPQRLDHSPAARRARVRQWRGRSRCPLRSPAGSAGRPAAEGTRLRGPRAGDG